MEPEEDDISIRAFREFRLDGMRNPNMEYEGRPLIFHLLGSLDQCDYVNEKRAWLLVQLLIRGADVNIREWRRGMRPLHYCDLVEDARALIKYGAAINARGEDGATPLFSILAHDPPPLSLVRFLLSRGAELERIEVSCESPVFRTRSCPIHCKWDSRNRKHPWRRGALHLIRVVKAAGSVKKYLREPRVQLVRLRLLCGRGRAFPPMAARTPYWLLFSGLASSMLPNDLFWYIISFWRTERDDELDWEVPFHGRWAPAALRGPNDP